MPAGKKPQPAGALGRWVAQTSLPTPRGEAAVKRVGDRIFAAGGCTTVTSTPTCNGTGGETATIDIANLTAAAVASYGSATLTAPRRRASITIANKLTAPGEFTSLASNLNDQWLMVLYGDAAAGNPNGPSGSDAAKVIANGSAVAAPTFANTAYGPTGFGVTGGWGEAIADLLLVFGNTGSTGFDFRVPQGSTTICGGGACTAASSFTATLTSSGAGAITNRYLPGEVLFRAYVYAAGGLTNATSAATAQATVDRIVY
jgi:hypothetical protein